MTSSKKKLRSSFQTFDNKIVIDYFSININELRSVFSKLDRSSRVRSLFGLFLNKRIT